MVKYIKYVAKMLIELEEMGIQIFIATHSLFLVKEIEIEIARKFLENRELFIIFHIEIPPPQIGLKQSNYKMEIIRKKLREKLKSVIDGQNIKVGSKSPNGNFILMEN